MSHSTIIQIDNEQLPYIWHSFLHIITLAVTNADYKTDHDAESHICNVLEVFGQTLPKDDIQLKAMCAD